MLLPSLRQYLRSAAPGSGHDILLDVFVGLERGAIQILRLCLLLRNNRRTRRSEHEVAAEWRRLRRWPRSFPARWYVRVVETVMSMYRLYRTFAFPMLERASHADLQDSLSRQTRRLLGYTGTVQVAIPTLRSRASAVVSELYQLLRGSDVVVWLDNWYAERYSTNPDRPVLSQDVTAVAVLFLSPPPSAPAASRTRRHTVPAFPGHRTLDQMVLHVDAAVIQLEYNLVELCDRVERLLALNIDPTAIRVPLDVCRPARRTHQWRSLTLSENRVGAHVELLAVLEDLLRMQAHVGKSMPLLVDEKVHYALMRMMHSRMLRDFNVGGWLQQLPLLYGVWHPYKQAVAVVYRTFFPIFGLLDCTGRVVEGSTVRVKRKLLYMEKVVAAVLLCSKSMLPRVASALDTARSAPVVSHSIH